MDLAMKKAVEGGYKTQWTGNAHHQELVRASILMDALFWQALGKAMGWKNTLDVLIHPKLGEVKNGRGEWQEWQFHWHRFIDALSEGKSLDDFFKELLTN